LYLESNFFVGAVLIILGLIYTFWNLDKKYSSTKSNYTKADYVNSWGIVFCLLLLGIVFLLREV